MRRLGLDRVVWLVSPQNPLKSSHETAPLSERMASARAAAATVGPAMIVSYDGVQFDETGQNKNAGIVIVQVANVDGKPDRVTVWPKAARRAGYVPAFPANK